MDRESVERLRFDRRLQSRAGWVEADAEEAYLETLPDVTDKMTTCAEEADAAEEAAAATPQPSAEPRAEVTAPVAGDFSTSVSASVGQPRVPSTPSAPFTPPTPTTPAPSSTSQEPSALPDQGSAGTFPGEAQAADRLGEDTEAD